MTYYTSLIMTSFQAFYGHVPSHFLDTFDSLLASLSVEELLVEQEDANQMIK